MTFIRGRFWRTSVAAMAAWALACDSGGSEPNTPPVASVVVSPSSVELKSIGATQQLTATPLDASGTAVPGRSVSWATSNAVVARVSANGLVTGIAAGTTTVTATSEEKLGTALVSVATPPPATVAEVVVTPPSPSAWVGRSQQLTATTLDAAGATLSGRAVTWSSLDVSVATVGTSGVARGVAAGTVTITATSDGKFGAVSLTSANPPAGVILTGIYDAASSVNQCPTTDAGERRERLSVPLRPERAPERDGECAVRRRLLPAVARVHGRQMP